MPQDLTAIVAQTCKCSKAEAKEALAYVFSAIAEDVTLLTDGIRIPELGTFRRIATEARQGRNPRTMEPIEIAAGYRVLFSAGSALKRRLGELAPPRFAPKEQAA